MGVDVAAGPGHGYWSGTGGADGPELDPASRPTRRRERLLVDYEEPGQGDEVGGGPISVDVGLTRTDVATAQQTGKEAPPVNLYFGLRAVGRTEGDGPAVGKVHLQPAFGKAGEAGKNGSGRERWPAHGLF